MPKKKKTDEVAAETAATPRPKPKTAGVKKPAKKAASRRKGTAGPTSPAQPSDEDIRLRAYFISERRRRLDLPGDASADWIEARRQLQSES